MSILKKRTAQKSFSLTLAIFFGLISGCGGGSSGGDNTNNEDTTAPTVSSTSPASNAVDVAISSVVTAAFNEDILSTSVDASSFTLAKSSGENAAGTITFDGANNIASFTPSDNLSQFTAYTATLSTNIADLSGNALANIYN